MDEWAGTQVQETLQAGDLDNEPHTNHYLVEKAWLSLKRHTNRDADTHGRCCGEAGRRFRY